jgi:hypothetical protein
VSKCRGRSSSTGSSSPDDEAHQAHLTSATAAAFQAAYHPVLAAGPLVFTDYTIITSNTQALGPLDAPDRLGWHAAYEDGGAPTMHSRPRLRVRHG